jgi:hypothetical protein
MDHQRGDVNHIIHNRRVLLANEPGCGKSRSAIEATAGAATLVIAPSMVITGGTWDEEIGRWAEHPDLYTVVPYSMLCTRERGPRGGSRPVKRLRDEYRGVYDAVIVDEAHYTKGRHTTWTWAVEQAAKRAELVVEMTGTPIPNWADELFTILRVLFPEDAKRKERLGSFWRWAEAWFDTTPTRFSNGNPVVGELLSCTAACLSRPSTDPCEHYHEFVRANLGSRYRRVLRDDCLDLPPLTTQTVKVPLDAAVRAMYNRMKRDFTATIDGIEVVSWSRGARSVALDRLTTSPWLLTQEGAPHGGKLDRLAFDLSSRSRPTLVLAHYNATVEACAQVARQSGARAAHVNGRTTKAQDAANIAAFKGGGLDVLAASLEKVAEGLTLTSADMAIFVETSFKPYRNTQARYRVHRIGQTRPVTILDYVCPGTVDARKRRLLATKTDRQMRYLSAAEYLSLL